MTVSSVQLLSRVQLFATPWTTAHQSSLSITNSRSPPKLMSIEWVMPSSHLILCHPLFLLPLIPPSIRVFSNESALRIRWPKWAEWPRWTKTLLLLLLLSCFSRVWLCDPIDGSPPGSPIPGIPRARTMEWVAISFSNAWKWKVKVKLLSRVQLFATPRTAAYQAPLSMGFSRQEYWSRVPSPSPSPCPNTHENNLNSLFQNEKSKHRKNRRNKVKIINNRDTVLSTLWISIHFIINTTLWG